MAAGNTFGDLFRITTYGESHGDMLGVVIDGCPSKLELSIEKIQHEMERRKPGQSNKVGTARKEPDKSQISSGYMPPEKECVIVTTGQPIHMYVINEGAKSEKYIPIKISFRQSHADYTFWVKYNIRDWRGGGRSSARETVARVMAGAVAKQALQNYTRTKVFGATVCVGGVEAVKRDYEYAETNILRCPDPDVYEAMMDRVKEAERRNDSVGGAVEVVAKNVYAGLGEPVFDKLNALLMHALGSIPSVKAVEIGDGRKVESMFGAEYRDVKEWVNGKMIYRSNHGGGIEGGISNGEDIVTRLSIKPVPTIIGTPILMPDEEGKNEMKTMSGDHDRTIMPRAVPVAESMMWITLFDCFLKQKAYESLRTIS